MFIPHYQEYLEDLSLDGFDVFINVKLISGSFQVVRHCLGRLCLREIVKLDALSSVFVVYGVFPLD